MGALIRFPSQQSALAIAENAILGDRARNGYYALLTEQEKVEANLHRPVTRAEWHVFTSANQIETMIRSPNPGQSQSLEEPRAWLRHSPLAGDDE